MKTRDTIFINYGCCYSASQFTANEHNQMLCVWCMKSNEIITSK